VHRREETDAAGEGIAAATGPRAGTQVPSVLQDALPALKVAGREGGAVFVPGVKSKTRYAAGLDYLYVAAGTGWYSPFV
jgi:hypothetical protein